MTPAINVIINTSKIPNKTPLTVDFFFKLKYKALKPITGAEIAPIIQITTVTIGINTVGIMTIIAWAGLTDSPRIISDITTTLANII